MVWKPLFNCCIYYQRNCTPANDCIVKVLCNWVIGIHYFNSSTPQLSLKSHRKPQQPSPTFKNSEQASATLNNPKRPLTMGMTQSNFTNPRLNSIGELRILSLQMRFCFWNAVVISSISFLGFFQS